jgi:hypothetical protein
LINSRRKSNRGSATAKAVKMKALSPFLPDVSTLSELFASAGIASSLPSARAGAALRGAALGGARADPGPSAVSPAGGLPLIRFPSRAPTITRAGTPAVAPSSSPALEVPTKGPARAVVAEPAPRGPASTAPAPAPNAHSERTAPSAPAPAANDALSDEVALRQIFGQNERATLPLQRRLEGFVEWLGGAVAARAAFVADADGLVLANRNAPESYVVATASLSHAEDTVLKSYIPRPPEGTTTMDLDETHFLQVIRVDTVVGRLVVGLIVAGPLSRSACAMVRRLLRLGVEEERPA